MKEKFKFRSKHFYELLNQQKYRCALTNRELTPENTNAEHIQPISKGGKHEVENICLVVDMVGKLKRYFSEEEIVLLASDIIKTKGKKYGFEVISKNRKASR